MFNEVKKSIQWGEETLSLETGKVARQADGSVIATLGETSVMANVTFARKQKPGQDFFPLTVHYQITKKNTTLLVKYRAVFSNAKRVQRKKRR